MVLFDSWIQEGPLATVETFWSPFDDGYVRSADRPLEEATITSFIGARVMALQRWIANPSEAPIGIRNASPEWIGTLERFVSDWVNESDLSSE